MRKTFVMLTLMLGTLVFSTSGCAQHAATNYVMDLTVVPPTGSYSFVFSRVIVTGSNCPTATTGTYTMLNDATATAATNYEDNTVAGLKVCYVAQSKDTSVTPAAYSLPSNTAGPFNVPANPLAPTLSGSQTTTSAEMVKPQVRPQSKPMPVKTNGKLPTPVLTASLRAIGK